MRVAFISYEYPPETATGGIGTYTYQMARLLSDKSADVHIFAGSFTRNDISVDNGVLVHWVKCKDPSDFQIKLLSHFKKEQTIKSFDLAEAPEIHANAKVIKQKYPLLPLIIRLHAPNYLVESLKKKYMPLKNKWRFFLGALRRGKWDLGYWRRYNYLRDADFIFTKSADFIFAPTIQMKNWAVKYWYLNPDLIKVVENPFVKNNTFKNALSDNGEKTIIFYGRLNVLKGLITATLAMERILKKNHEWKWIIVGDDGPAADGRSSMHAWMNVRLQEVKKQVEFYDTVQHDEVPFFLKQASIVLVPSLFESYSYVTIEAMSAGKAVIGSDQTGISSLIKDKKNGMLVDPYKIKHWQYAIQQLIDDEVLRKQLGKAAYRYAENKHSESYKIVEFYKEILQRIPAKV